MLTTAFSSNELPISTLLQRSPELIAHRAMHTISAHHDIAVIRRSIRAENRGPILHAI